MRALLLILISMFLVACESKPTDEFRDVMAKYRALLEQTADLEYGDPRFDAIAAKLRAVPASNSVEHRKAQALAEEIEKGRAAIKARRNALSTSVRKHMKNRPILKPLRSRRSGAKRPNHGLTIRRKGINARVKSAVKKRSQAQE